MTFTDKVEILRFEAAMMQLLDKPQTPALVSLGGKMKKRGILTAASALLISLFIVMGFAQASNATTQTFRNAMTRSDTWFYSVSGTHTGGGVAVNYDGLGPLLWSKASLGIYGDSSGFKYYYLEADGPSYSKIDQPVAYGATHAGCVWWSNLGKPFDSNLRCDRFYR